MLKITGEGWAQISIDGAAVYRASYLTDVPCDFMKALFDYLNANETDERNARPSSSVYVDSEGGTANFVFSDMCYSGNGQKVFMFYSVKGGWQIRAFDEKPENLAKELVRDIGENFDGWVKWYGNDESTETGKRILKINKENLSYWLEKLKEAIAAYGG